MSENDIKIRRCPICNSEKIVFFVKTFDRHYGWNDKFYDIYTCLNCKLLFLNPIISEQELFKMYPKDNYYAYNAFELGLPKFKYLLKKIKNILIGYKTTDLKKFDFEDKRVLDIGCGSGKTLFELKNRGAEVYGIEISKNASDVGNQNNLNIYNGTLVNAQYPKNYFDYIRTNHSFEHISNPQETLVEIKRILKREGILFIGVPNTDSLMFKIFKKYWYYLGVPFHPYNYNIKNLKMFLELNGFRIINIYYNSNFNGIVGSVQILLNAKNGKKSNEGIFTNIFTILIFHQVARFLNLIKLGDCIEIFAIKK